MTQDLDAILRTIQDVEESLDRRASRALGATLLVWGLVGASIFAFYQLVAWNREPYADALGPALRWVWLAPVALGYVASAIIGARMGRMSDERRRELRAAAVPGALTTLLVAFAILTGRPWLINGGVVLLSGAAFLLISWRAPASATRSACVGVGAAMCLAGIALLFVNASWGTGAAALAFALGFGIAGTVIYRRGR